MPTVRNFRAKRRRPSNANPVVSYLTSAISNGTYGIDSQIPIRLRANCSLIVSGQPVITLNTTPPFDAVYSTGSGTQDLTFLATPPGGTTVGSLDVASSSAMTGGTITSAESDYGEVCVMCPACWLSLVVSLFWWGTGIGILVWIWNKFRR